MNTVIEMEACTMKKLTFIIILTLLAIAAICAADKEVHTIRIASVVEEVLPTFQFELTSGMLEEQDATVLELNQGSENSENRRVIYVPDINKNDLDLTFTAKLSNEARCQGSFTLKLTAGDFIVTKLSGVENLSPSGVEAAVANDVASRHGVDAQLSGDGNEINISFSGASCIPGDLATFTVRYPSDPDILPDIYYTDISLEVSSNF